MFGKLLAVLFSILLATPASADPDPMAAAGRIEDIVGGGSCSAALVAPDVVVTAAHCLESKEDPTALQFRTGGYPDAPAFAVDQIAIHPLYDRINDPWPWRFRFDMAVAHLGEAVPADVAVPFAPGGEASVGEALYLVSWRSGSRPRQRTCPVIAGIYGLVTLACEVRGGESGAPVLRKTASGLQIVAVISSRVNQGSQPVAQASDIHLRLPPLLRLVD